MSYNLKSLLKEGKIYILINVYFRVCSFCIVLWQYCHILSSLKQYAFIISLILWFGNLGVASWGLCKAAIKVLDRAWVFKWGRIQADMVVGIIQSPVGCWTVGLGVLLAAAVHLPRVLGTWPSPEASSQYGSLCRQNMDIIVLSSHTVHHVCPILWVEVSYRSCSHSWRRTWITEGHEYQEMRSWRPDFFCPLTQRV